MSNLKILVLEDEEASASYLTSILAQSGYESVYACATLAAALEAYERHDPDLCILDVYIKGSPDGIAFAEQVIAQGARKPFLFLTAAHDLATFRLAKFTSPSSYLLKPYNPLELTYALELALEKCAPEAVPARPVPVSQNDFLFVKRGNTLMKVMLNDIVYIEVEGKYCNMVCHSEKLIVQQPLKDLLERLPDNRFFRIHRNYVVNINEVSKINMQNDECLLKNGQSLVFSRRYIDAFLRYFEVLK